MYSGEDGDVCVELGYVGKGISVLKVAQPDKSKVGGSPAWFGEPPVSVGDLVCRLCGRDLFLIAQVYAPTHVQRSLCIFGCIRAACSVQPRGWRVIRTQKPQSPPEPTLNGADLTAPSPPANGVPSSPPTKVELSECVSSAWGASDEPWDALGSEGGDWGAEAEEWGQGIGIVSGGDATTATIDALLQEQEQRSNQKVKDQTARLTAGCKAQQECTATEKEIQTPLSTENGEWEHRCFPPKAVIFLPEPWEEKSSGVVDQDMEERLKRYRKQEEDQGLVAALDHALGLKSGGSASAPGSQRGGEAAIAGEKYERTPAKARAIMRFAERVTRSPQQVIRYAYGGRALWSSYDPPKENIPPCTCGATRVFEMQLMPAMLLQLRANDFAEREICKPPNSSAPSTDTTSCADGSDGEKSTSALGQATESLSRPKGINFRRTEIEEKRGRDSAQMVGEGDESDEDEEHALPVPSAEEYERLKTWGMDWGVVGIWSCPGSCEASCEEFALVQLPV